MYFSWCHSTIGVVGRRCRLYAFSSLNLKWNDEEWKRYLFILKENYIDTRVLVQSYLNRIDRVKVEQKGKKIKIKRQWIRKERVSSTPRRSEFWMKNVQRTVYSVHCSPIENLLFSHEVPTLLFFIVLLEWFFMWFRYPFYFLSSFSLHIIQTVAYLPSFLYDCSPSLTTTSVYLFSIFYVFRCKKDVPFSLFYCSSSSSNSILQIRAPQWRAQCTALIMCFGIKWTVERWTLNNIHISFNCFLSTCAMYTWKLEWVIQRECWFLLSNIYSQSMIQVFRNKKWEIESWGSEYKSPISSNKTRW